MSSEWALEYVGDNKVSLFAVVCCSVIAKTYSSAHSKAAFQKAVSKQSALSNGLPGIPSSIPAKHAAGLCQL